MYVNAYRYVWQSEEKPKITESRRFVWASKRNDELSSTIAPTPLSAINSFLLPHFAPLLPSPPEGYTRSPGGEPRKQAAQLENPVLGEKETERQRARERKTNGMKSQEKEKRWRIEERERLCWASLTMWAGKGIMTTVVAPFSRVLVRLGPQSRNVGPEGRSSVTLNLSNRRE